MNTPDRNPLDILKSALLLEMRGRSFYSKVAAQTDKESVRAFFTMMAEEEEQHVRELSKQYKAYKAEGAFVPSVTDTENREVADKVMTEGLKKQIDVAGFEAAAVAAAMSMEERAIRLYSDQAKAAADTEERAIYHWLADWERRHLEMLAEIDRDLTEDVWNDNNFWPF